jgi:cell division transport system permease protein
MIRIAHIARELFRNLRRNPGTAFASVLSLTLLFLLFDLFWVAAGTSDRFYQDLLSDLKVEVFISEEVSDSSTAAIGDQLSKVEGVLHAEYISREKARRRLTGLVGADLLVGYDETNPLPRSYVLTPEPGYLSSGELEEMERRIGAIKGTGDVHYSRTWLAKAENTKSIFLQVGLILGGLILATAVVSSTNNIRLMTRARAVGFRQMLLLGAGRLFISMPFIVEGFIIGGLSAALGWAIIFYGRTKITFSRIEIVFPSQDDIILFCIVTALLGAVSGYFGLRQLLKDQP